MRKVFVLCFIVLCAGITVKAEDKGEFREFWQEFYVFKNFSEKIQGELMFNNLHSFEYGNYDWFVEGKMKYNATAWMYMEFMYRHEFYDHEGAKVQEYRPMFRVAGKTKLGNWSVRNRHRIEYRMFELGGDHFRYRTDVRVKPNWDLTALNINPYLTEEIFISKGRMTRNRFYGGISGQKGRFEPALYFLVQSDDRETGWEPRNIVGVILGIEI